MMKINRIATAMLLMAGFSVLCWLNWPPGISCSGLMNLPGSTMKNGHLSPDVDLADQEEFEKNNDQASGNPSASYRNHPTDGNSSPLSVFQAGLSSSISSPSADLKNADASISGQLFNIRDYGAVGNGIHDDTKAIQDAVNAALLQNGTVYFPAPPNFYRITNTIDVIPSSGDQVAVNFKGEGNWNMIEFHSKKGRACFNIRGIKRAIFEGVHVVCKYDDQIAWSIVCDTAHQSQSSLLFRLCHVGLSGKCSTGFHLTTTGGAADISVVHFESCNVGGSDGKAAIGWLDTNANGLGYVWTNCGASHLHSFYNNMGREAELDEDISATQTTIRIKNPEMFPQRGGKIRIQDEYIHYTSVTGTALAGCRRGQDGSSPAGHGKGSICRIDTWQGGGGEGKTFINCVNSYNEHDFFFGSGGSYLVLGGRFEVGKKFARFGTWGTSHIMFSLMGATLTQYGRGSGADAGVVFHIGMPVKLLIEGCLISQENYTSSMIKDVARVSPKHSGVGGAVTIRNSSIQNTAGTRKFWTLQDHYKVVLENVSVANLAGHGLAVLNTTPKNNFNATSDPTAKSDESIGFQAGSRWINTATGVEYVCVNPGVGKAVWKKTTP